MDPEEVKKLTERAIRDNEEILRALDEFDQKLRSPGSGILTVHFHTTPVGQGEVIGKGSSLATPGSASEIITTTFSDRSTTEGRDRKILETSLSSV